MTTALEQAVDIAIADYRLVGVVHHVQRSCGDVGVVVVVGGPQYRIGSHRQFVLLGRALASGGIPVLRFDYSGMGDSDGTVRTFAEIDEDIAAAIDFFVAAVPEVQRVVIWALCDGASAALMYAPKDPRVKGIVMLNPWVRTEAGLAKSQLWTYYPRRLISRNYWRKVAWRPATVIGSARQLIDTLRRSRKTKPVAGVDRLEKIPDFGFLERMIEAAERFDGAVEVLLSGSDITAGEFKALLADDRRWRRAFRRPGVIISELPDANHTFSSANWRDWVAGKTLTFVRTL